LVEILSRLIKRDPSLCKVEISWVEHIYDNFIEFVEVINNYIKSPAVPINLKTAGTYLIVILAATLRKNSQVKSLRLSGFRFNKQSAQALADALAQNTTLATFVLHASRLEDEIAAILSQGLAENR